MFSLVLSCPNYSVPPISERKMHDKTKRSIHLYFIRTVVQCEKGWQRAVPILLPRQDNLGSSHCPCTQLITLSVWLAVNPL